MVNPDWLQIYTIIDGWGVVAEFSSCNERSRPHACGNPVYQCRIIFSLQNGDLIPNTKPRSPALLMEYSNRRTRS